MKQLKTASLIERRNREVSKLKVHDEVRIVTCDPEDVDVVLDKDICIADDATFDPKGKQPRRLLYPGIDFIWEERDGFTNIHLCFVFKRLKGGSNTVLRCQNGGVLPPTIPVQELLPPTMIVGAEFRHRNGRVLETYIITAIDITRSTVVCYPIWYSSEDSEDVDAIEFDIAVIASKFGIVG